MVIYVTGLYHEPAASPPRPSLPCEFLRAVNASNATSDPQFAVALAEAADTQQGAAAALAGIRQSLSGPIDLAMVFVTPHHVPQLEQLAAALCEGLETELLLGCTAESVVTTRREVEETPAISLWAAQLPGADLQAMQLRFERTLDGGSITGWPDQTTGEWPADASLLLLGEPYSFPVDVLTARMNEDRPGTAVIGGMASGAFTPGENRLILGRQVVSEGAVAVRLAGGVRLRSVVSQGCRPIGEPMVVTKAEANVIYELGGQPALACLQRLFRTLPVNEQRLAQQGLNLGRVVSEYQDRFEPGDFLIRNVIGVSEDEGLAIGDYIRVGQTVQFHLRDADSASQEFHGLLAQQRATNPLAGLLFTCNGRGSRLFSTPDHDAGCVAAELGEIPLAGFFAQGEIGPVAKENFLHGFTASLALFERVPPP